MLRVSRNVGPFSDGDVIRLGSLRLDFGDLFLGPQRYDGKVIETVVRMLVKHCEFAFPDVFVRKGSCYSRYGMRKTLHNETSQFVLLITCIDSIAGFRTFHPEIKFNACDFFSNPAPSITRSVMFLLCKVKTSISWLWGDSASLSQDLESTRNSTSNRVFHISLKVEFEKRLRRKTWVSCLLTYNRCSHIMIVATENRTLELLQLRDIDERCLGY